MSNTERPIIKVNGSEIADEQYEVLTSVIVEQSVQVPDMFTIVFYDPDFELFDDELFKIGDPVDIGFSDGDDEASVTTSDITAITIQPAPSGRHELVVSGLGRGRSLASGEKIRIFEQVTTADVVNQIAGEYGLTAEVDAPATTYPWLIQESDDFRFLTERALLTGCMWWVTDQTLYFKKLAKNGTSPVRKWPDDLFSFKVRFSAADAVKSATVRGWDPDTQQSFTGASAVTVGVDQLGTDASAATDANTTIKKLAKTHTNGSAPIVDAAEAESLANSIVLRGVSEEIDARGVAVGEPGIKAGSQIEIDGMGDKLSGKYLLTSVDHVFRAGEQYVTRFRAGARTANSLVDLLRSTSSETTSLGSRLVAGVVTSTDDPDKANRVQVSIPSLGDDITSAWARLCAPGAGDSRGLLSYPELGDEVLVAFENANPRRPIIVGGLWSKKLKPPLDASAAIESNMVTMRGIYSRLGHKIELQDGTSDDTKAVSIELADGKTSFVMAQDNVALDAPKPLTITGQDTVTISADSKGITISGSSVTIKSSGDLSLEGNAVTIKGNSSVSIEGGQTDVKADGMLNVQAGGMASVKGSMVQLN